MINSVTLAGNVVRDVDIRGYDTKSKRNTVLKFTLAVNGYNNEAHFFDCEFWCTEKQANYFGSQLNKGAQVAVQGSLKQSKWEQNGEKKSRVLISVNEVFAPRNKDNQEAYESNDVVATADELYAEDCPF